LRNLQACLLLIKDSVDVQVIFQELARLVPSAQRSLLTSRNNDAQQPERVYTIQQHCPVVTLATGGSAK